MTRTKGIAAAAALVAITGSGLVASSLMAQADERIVVEMIGAPTPVTGQGAACFDAWLEGAMGIATADVGELNCRRDTPNGFACRALETTTQDAETFDIDEAAERVARVLDIEPDGSAATYVRGVEAAIEGADLAPLRQCIALHTSVAPGRLLQFILRRDGEGMLAFIHAYASAVSPRGRLACKRARTCRGVLARTEG